MRKRLVCDYSLLTTVVGTHALCTGIAYYVAFGPHGPRSPLSKPGDNFKIFLSTVGLVGLGGLLFLWTRSIGELPFGISAYKQEG